MRFGMARTSVGRTVKLHLEMFVKNSIDAVSVVNIVGVDVVAEVIDFVRRLSANAREFPTYEGTPRWVNGSGCGGKKAVLS